MSLSAKKNLFRQKLELLILNGSVKVLARIKPYVSSQGLQFRHQADFDFQSAVPPELLRAQIVLLVQEDGESLGSFASKVRDVIKKFMRSRFVVVFNEDPSEEIDFLQDSAVTPLSSQEFYSTLKLEYIFLYRCRAQYFEIALKDLFSQTQIDFPVFMRLPLNQRYLPVVYTNTMLSDDRFSRLQRVSSLYVRNRDSHRYLKYINTYFDTSGTGYKKRIRALLVSICSLTATLNEYLLFDLKKGTAQEVTALVDDLKGSASEFFKILKNEEGLWEILFDFPSEEFWNYCRAPWVAMYASLLSVKSGLGDPWVTFMSALLSDVGVYDLPEEVSRRFFENKEKSFGDEDKRKFETHPILSLNRCLVKGLQLDERVKSVLVCTHEQNNERGFPNQVPRDKLPVEAQLIFFADSIDRGSVEFMKQEDRSLRFFREKFWEQERGHQEKFSADFLDKIAEGLL